MIDVENLTQSQAEAIELQLRTLFNSDGWAVVQAFIAARTQERKKVLAESVPMTVEQMVLHARHAGQIEEVQNLPRWIEAYYTDLTTQLVKLREETTEDVDE